MVHECPAAMAADDHVEQRYSASADSM